MEIEDIRDYADILDELGIGPATPDFDLARTDGGPDEECEDSVREGAEEGL